MLACSSKILSADQISPLVYFYVGYFLFYNDMILAAPSPSLINTQTCIYIHLHKFFHIMLNGLFSTNHLLTFVDGSQPFTFSVPPL